MDQTIYSTTQQQDQQNDMLIEHDNNINIASSTTLPLSNSATVTPKMMNNVNKFLRMELPKTFDKKTWINFDTLSQLISQPQTIATTTSILDMFLTPLIAKNKKQCNRRARVFLTAYVILTCPESILQEAPVPQRKRLRLVAKRLLVNFENWINNATTTTTTTTRATDTTVIEQQMPPSVAKMRACWTNYVTLFQGWLYNDKTQLLAGMIAHYQELEQVRITLQRKGYNVMETNDACIELEHQLQQLEQKIKSIQGGAEMLERAKQQRERSSSNSTQQQQQQQQQQQCSDQNNNNDKNDNEESNQSSSSKKELTLQQQQEESKDHLREILPSTISSILTNEQLAHEIILNPNFKLERHHQNSIDRRVTDIATQAYFDKLAEDIENDVTKYNEIVPQLLYEIRERLNDLVAPSMRTELQEGIDIELIKQQLEQNVFNLDKMIEFILDLIQRSCASIRDPLVQQIRSLSSSEQGQQGPIIKQIQLIFDLLQEMALDLANHQLCSLRPHLLPIALKYSRSKFTHAMQEQDIQSDLPKTKQWLQKTIEQLQEKASQRNPENIELPPTLPLGLHLQEVFEEAMVSLIMSSELIHSDTCPETLRLDTGRLHEYQNDAQAITIVAALLTLTRNFGSTQQDDNDDLVKRLFILLEQEGTTVDHLATEIQRHCSTKNDNSDNNNEQENKNNLNEMIYAMVDKTLSHTDAIYSLLARRVSRVIKTYMNNSNKQQTRQEEKISDTTLQSYGLYQVRKPLHDLCIRIAALADYNYRVHDQWYKEQLEFLL